MPPTAAPRPGIPLPSPRAHDTDTTRTAGRVCHAGDCLARVGRQAGRAAAGAVAEAPPNRFCSQSTIGEAMKIVL
jgi:hypothetical protein